VIASLAPLAPAQRRIHHEAEARLHTVVFLLLALQAEGRLLSETALGGDVVGLVARTGPVAKSVLLILVLFSVASWAIIFHKLWQFRRAEAHTASFLEVFRKSSKFSEVQAVCRSLAASPLVGLFQTGYAELSAQLRQTAATSPPESRPANPSARPTLRSVDALDRALLRAAGVELGKLERRIPFLATTASITPFIGLFGTVWGIMTAFEAIGATGSTNLAVVAPGIAEALVNTAAGLFAAIPAVYFYNAFTYRVKMFAAQMEDFSLEFLNLAERNFT
jgi:biopolymer transport protein TolQ